MNRKRVGTVMVVLGSVGILAGARLAVAEGGDAAKKEGVEAKAAFARLKTLAGTWKVKFGGNPDAGKAKDHQEKHDASPATVTFRLTGAGSTVVETQFPGQGHEMITMYHLDGQDLRMTHYCARGESAAIEARSGSFPAGPPDLRLRRWLQPRSQERPSHPRARDYLSRQGPRHQRVGRLSGRQVGWGPRVQHDPAIRALQNRGTGTSKTRSQSPFFEGLK